MTTPPTDRNEMDEHLTGEAAVAKARQLLPGFRTTMLVMNGPEEYRLHEVRRDGTPGKSGRAGTIDL